MKPTRYYIALSILSVCIICVGLSCASTGNPSGGRKDEDPPKLIRSKSTANLQTNFEKQEIELYFDEFVNLKNAAQQVVMSPPLIYPLQFDHKGKRIKISFHENEVLKDDVTYSINFGEAIEDFREGNKLTNFKFVFSTGDKLDSLSIGGKVIDAYTREPVENILVMLYDTLDQDSIPYIHRPYYFARTDEEGRYRIDNMKSDTFRIFALGDANLNYIYDQDTEAIGFLDSLYIVSDSTNVTADLEVYTESQAPKLYETSTDQLGVIRMEFSAPPDEVDYTFSDSTLQVTPQVKNDSLLLWYELPTDSVFMLYILDDTITVNTNRAISMKSPLILQASNASLSSGLTRLDSLILEYPRPVRSIDSCKIVMTLNSDTLNTPILGWSTGLRYDDTSIYISYPWREGDTLMVSLDSAAVADIQGNQSDSTGLKFRIVDMASRGTLLFEMDSLDAEVDYLVKILLKDKEIYSAVLTRENDNFTIRGLLPGSYRAEIIADLNGNRKWDPGNYLQRKLPEVIRRVDIEEIRADWDVESRVLWHQLK